MYLKYALSIFHFKNNELFYFKNTVPIPRTDICFDRFLEVAAKLVSFSYIFHNTACSEPCHLAVQISLVLYYFLAYLLNFVKLSWFKLFLFIFTNAYTSYVFKGGSYIRFTNDLELE